MECYYLIHFLPCTCPKLEQNQNSINFAYKYLMISISKFLEFVYSKTYQIIRLSQKNKYLVCLKAFAIGKRRIINNERFKVVLCAVFIANFGYNCYIFQEAAIYNDEKQCKLLRLKNKKMCLTLFISVGQLHLYTSV